MTREARNLRALGRLFRCPRRWYLLESKSRYRARLLEVMARWEGPLG